jgi:nucleotidyltransferase-like protein
MVRAVWNGAVLAESDHTVKVEGNHYFPPQSLHREYFTASRTTSTCPWKGLARYYSITVGGKNYRRRENQPGRGLVLRRAQPRSQQDHRARRVLARRPHRARPPSQAGNRPAGPAAAWLTGSSGGSTG